MFFKHLQGEHSQDDTIVDSEEVIFQLSGFRTNFNSTFENA